jgi:LemA protein
MALGAGVIAGIVIGLVLVLVGLWYISTYNRLIRMKNEVARAWGNIDVLLKQRYDMLPNLVSTVKGYAKHEKSIFKEFAKARQAAAGARETGDVAGVSAAEGLLGGIMPRILAVAEDYPELKADKGFVKLQDEITSIENQIADRREFYNSSSTNWNTAIQQIPANIVANSMNAEAKELFEVSAVEREAVKIEF